MPSGPARPCKRDFTTIYISKLQVLLSPIGLAWLSLVLPRLEDYRPKTVWRHRWYPVQICLTAGWRRRRTAKVDFTAERSLRLCNASWASASLHGGEPEPVLVRWVVGANSRLEIPHHQCEREWPLPNVLQVPVALLGWTVWEDAPPGIQQRILPALAAVDQRGFTRFSSKPRKHFVSL